MQEEIFGCTEQRLWLYMGMIHSAKGMWIWCFSEKGELYYTSCPHEKELMQFFFIGGCLDYAMEEGMKLHHPFIMSDSIGLVWAGEYVPMGNERRLVVIGPVFYAETSMQYIRESLKEMELSVQTRAAASRILDGVPVVSMDMFNQYIKMMHYAITCEDQREFPLCYQVSSEGSPGRKENLSGEGAFERRGAQQELILQCIRDGNKEYEKVFKKLKVFDTEYLRSGNPNRDLKNIMIIFISQCAKAAIDGGLAPGTSSEIEWKYIAEVEKQKTVSDLIKLNKEMMDEFVVKVSECKENTDLSRPIQECCNYVKSHFTEPLTLEKIAKAVGYTEYYLSRKFQKEMGVKLLDYIKDIRLEYAKVWLTASGKSIQEISDQLQFGARSYFSRVFKEKNGVTPAEYRDRVWNG